MSRPPRPPLAALLAAAAIALAAAPLAAQRELHWREIAVAARLEADGTLAVSERQAMVFTGDWNGGERRFRLRLGQQLDFDGMARLDPATGVETALSRGALDQVDHWDWKGGSTVRWRSRRPGDPPFSGTEIVYRLDYRLSGILRRAGETWILDHDFAFPDRDGAIERFSVDLALAPEWRPAAGFAGHWEAGPLPPGDGYVVHAELGFAGAVPPGRAAPARVPPAAVGLGLGLAALGASFFLRGAIARERELGRLAPLPAEAIDRDWLERHVFCLAPEEVGAAWDRSIGSAEVASMLARMQLEGKLDSRVESRGLLVKRPILCLNLRVDRDRLPEAERKLVDGLFPSGDATDTELLRRHYRSSGFDPAGRIKSAIEASLSRKPGLGAARPRPPRRPSVVLVLAGFALLVVAALLSPANPVVPIFLGVALVVSWLPALIAAVVLRGRVVGFVGPGVWMALGLAAGLVAMAGLLLLPGASLVALAAGVLLFLGLARAVSTAMQSREGAEAIAVRRRLAAARAWFAAELGRPSPALDDAWVPYLIAFGLASAMDRWFRAFGEAAGRMATPGAGGGFSGGGSSSASGGGWSGGGGQFGGAGASSTWALAATSMSAGVAAASSSSGGGGGGGGSSGGGGGGGW